MSAILVLDKVSRHFGGLRAVHQVSLDVQEGELHAVIGPNGAGKSTLFNLITGRFPPTEGRIHFKGKEITGTPQHRVARLGIGRSYQITTLFKNLSVLDNVKIAIQQPSAYSLLRPARGLQEVQRKAEKTLAAVGLLAKADLPATHLSHGEQRHLDIAVALARDPSLLLLDEPTAGMSPMETEATVELIHRLKQRATILLVEHKTDVIMRISDRITVLHFGQVLAQGSPADIRANRAVQEAYLGGTA